MTKLVFALVLAAGCTDSDSVEPTQHLPHTQTPTFTLYVSNQSFDRDLVDMQVEIDGRLAVSGKFDVGSQHSWHPFAFGLTPGVHQISVTSKNVSETLSTTVTVEPNHFGVLDYWYEASDNEPAHFSFFASETKPGFE